MIRHLQLNLYNSISSYKLFLYTDFLFETWSTTIIYVICFLFECIFIVLLRVSYMPGFILIIVTIQINVRHCGKQRISVNMDYTIKAMQINFAAVIDEKGIVLHEGNEINYQYCVRFFVPIIEVFRNFF